MLFAIDIDQTACGSNAYSVYASFHNNDLHLQIDDLVLEQLTSYRDFLLLPQVQAFRQCNEREWNASRHRAIADPWVIEAFSPMDGAVQGICSLSLHGKIGYYTARTPVVRDATQHWLASHSFAQSQQVICCSSVEQKMLALASHHPQDEAIVLIDDRGHTHVLATLDRLKEDTQICHLLPRLRIVAFGVSPSALPETPLCPLFALPHWHHLQTVLPLIL